MPLDGWCTSLGILHTRQKEVETKTVTSGISGSGKLMSVKCSGERHGSLASYTDIAYPSFGRAEWFPVEEEVTAW